MTTWLLKIQAFSFIHNEFIGGRTAWTASGKGCNCRAVSFVRLGGGIAVPPDLIKC